jgi:predicted RNA polymerase sigma factor
MVYSPPTARNGWSLTTSARLAGDDRSQPRDRPLVDRLELDQYHYLHSTRAELLRRLNRVEDACAANERALEHVSSDAERRFLEQRLAELRRSNIEK